MSLHRACCCAAATLFAQTYAPFTNGGRLYGMTPAGDVLWSFTLGARSSGITSGAYGKLGLDDECVYVPIFRASDWQGATGNATLLAIKRNGTLKWSFDSGGSFIYSAFALGDGSVIAVGSRSSTWTGSGGSNASIWKIGDDGSVVWSFDDAVDGYSFWDVAVDNSGNVFAAVANSAAGTYDIVKLDSGGAKVADSSGILSPTSTNNYLTVDCDVAGLVFLGGAFGDPATILTDVGVVNNTLTSVLWTLDVFGDGGRGLGIRAMNAATQRAMTLIRQTSNQLYQVSASGVHGSSLSTGSGVSNAIALSNEDTVYTYCGGGRNSNWTGHTGTTANMGKADSTISTWPPSGWAWVKDLSLTSTSEQVVRIIAEKHPNTA